MNRRVFQVLVGTILLASVAATAHAAKGWYQTECQKCLYKGVKHEKDSKPDYKSECLQRGPDRKRCGGLVIWISCDPPR